MDEAAALENRIGLYPNPTTGEFTLSYNLNASEQISIKVVNSLGQTVSEISKADMSAGTLSLDLSNHSSGVYMLHITTGDQSAVKRIVVAK
jgi:hypothetical protein